MYINIFKMYKNILMYMNVFTHSLNDFLEVSAPLLFFSFSFLFLIAKSVLLFIIELGESFVLFIALILLFIVFFIILVQSLLLAQFVVLFVIIVQSLVLAQSVVLL
jgi:hypothetical protein